MITENLTGKRIKVEGEDKEKWVVADNGAWILTIEPQVLQIYFEIYPKEKVIEVVSKSKDDDF